MGADPTVAGAVPQPHEPNINHATDEQLPNDHLPRHAPSNATTDVHNDKDSITGKAGDSAVNDNGNQDQGGDESEHGGDEKRGKRGDRSAHNVQFDVSAYLKGLEDRLRLLEEKPNISSEAAVTTAREHPRKKPDGEYTLPPPPLPPSTNAPLPPSLPTTAAPFLPSPYLYLPPPPPPPPPSLPATAPPLRPRPKDFSPLKLDHNILTWTQWRRMKYNEQKKDKYETRTMGEHVIDVVFDGGDLSLHPDGLRSYRLWQKAFDKDKDCGELEQSRFYLFSAWMANQIQNARKNCVSLDKWLGDQDGRDSRVEEMGNRSFKTDAVGRIRINSEIIIDTLNEVTGINLPTPCIFLHPFKVLVANEKIIRDHYQELLTEDKKNQETAQVGSKEKRSIDGTDHPSEPEENAHPDSLVDGTARRPEFDSTDERAIPKAQDDGVDEALAKKESEKRMTGEPKNFKLIHFERLIDVMDSFLYPELRIAEDIAQHRLDHIYFSHLWHLFPPGEVITVRQIRPDSPEQLYRVIKVSGGRHNLRTIEHDDDSRYWQKDIDETYKGNRSAFVIDCFYVDFDGENFRPVHRTFSIQNYEDTRSIEELEVIPILWLSPESREKLMETHRRRGAIFLELAKVKAAHREYTGMTVDSDTREEIDSRIIVDFSHPEVIERKVREVDVPNDRNRKVKRAFGIGILSKTDSRELVESYGRTSLEIDQTLYNDTNVDQHRTNKLFSNIPILRGRQELAAAEIMPSELILMPGQAFAFVIRLRDFKLLNVTLIRDVQLNKSGFDDLVLPKRHRKLIKALVDRHATGSRPVETRSTDEHPASALNDSPDIVRGKGKGLVILLHGVPGVGKTSTAETIADATGRPLIPVTSGDIGETTKEVEKNLARTFTLAHRWGCVLLMDEADVFLSKRRKDDLRSNAIVSIFLRVLEYYSGILFLTTNRVGAIDEAFKSRIHVTLYYPPLDWRTTKEIFRVNLRRAKNRVDYDEPAILRFAKRHFHNNEGANRWNGRQIFNAFQTSIALAEYDALEQDTDTGEKPNLTEEHFKEVAKTSRKFEDYLQEVHGGEDDARINAMERIRADLYGLEEEVNPTFARRDKARPRKRVDSADLSSTEEEPECGSSVPQSGSDAEQDSEENDKTSKGKKKARRDDSSDRRAKSRKDKKKGAAESSSRKKGKKRASSDESEGD